MSEPASDPAIPFGSDRRIRVDAAFFAAAALFQSDEMHRYYLNGVYIEPHPEGGVIMVGTDGYAAAIVRDTQGFASAPFICQLPDYFLEKCDGIDPSSGLMPADIHFIGNMAFLTDQEFATDTEMDTAVLNPMCIAHSTPIDGTYPDWRRILPVQRDEDAPGAPYFSVNPRFLKRFRKALNLVDGRDNFLTIRATKKDEVIIIHGRSTDTFFGLVMPTLPPNEYSFPSWLTPRPEPEPEVSVPQAAS